MDMNMDMGGSGCSTSMFWNWDVIDVCLLAESWHIKNNGMMAATCIGVFLLAIVLEMLRRAGREYDQFILRQFQHEASKQPLLSKVYDDRDGDGCEPRYVLLRPSLAQQLTRSVIYAMTFGVAYILMLIAMAFNGYVIVSIILGAGVGKFSFDWMTQKILVGRNHGPLANGVETNSEPTVCCG
ncbi:ctr copper transporter [Xylariaceae sp. FL1272]|nr:ctr copper transporter [Xylariaceae sp. FL1272]